MSSKSGRNLLSRREAAPDPGQARRQKGGKATPQARARQLEYIRHMLVELRTMATDIDAGTLVYLLDMAALEATEDLKAYEFKTELFSDR